MKEVPHWRPLTWKSRTGESIVTESGLMIAYGWEIWGMCMRQLKDTEFFPESWKCSKIECGYSCTYCGYTKTHWTVYFKWKICMVYELCINKVVKKYKTELKIHVSKFHLMCKTWNNLNLPPPLKMWEELYNLKAKWVTNRLHYPLPQVTPLQVTEAHSPLVWGPLTRWTHFLCQGYLWIT